MQNEDIQIDGILQTILNEDKQYCFFDLSYSDHLREEYLLEGAQTLVNIPLILPQVKFVIDNSFFEQDIKYNQTFVEYNVSNSIVLALRWASCRKSAKEAE